MAKKFEEIKGKELIYMGSISWYEQELICDVISNLRLVFNNIGINKQFRDILLKIIRNPFKIFYLKNGVLDGKFKKWYSNLCVEQMHQNSGTWYRWLQFDIYDDFLKLSIGRSSNVARLVFKLTPNEIMELIKLDNHHISSLIN